VKLGDGRLRLAEAPDRSYDAIVLDVFGSEAVPAHFLTREAFEEYDAKLAKRGLLLFNVSQRYLDFEPLLAALAAEKGWTADVRFEQVPKDVEEATGRLTSRWVAVARTQADAAPLEERGWHRLSPRPGFRPWTDEFTDLLPLVRWL
jgi:spermidine synthase